jgi:wyosine [tRNA(Phe)-imidazoG37] synthetase (radical SAM superfamily)
VTTSLARGLAHRFLVLMSVGLGCGRWLEAFNVRHCALSLVGEPIM